ncbi:MAG: DUF3862 domain-containing protein [Carnobacterium sp.]
MAKKVMGQDGKMYKVKKPFYKKVWFWILALIVIAIIGGALGGGSDNKDTSKNADTEKVDADKKDSATSSKTSDPTLKDNFDKISLGDILSNGDGGTSLEDVKGIFGEPDSTSETNLEGQTAKMMTWGGPKGGGLMSSVVVSFSNDKAVSKAVTGLKVSKHDKVTLEQFNAVTTDGSFSEDQATQEFGEPDGISDTLVNGAKQSMLSWTQNVNGDIGANFNITFDNGVATSKSNTSMK